MSIERKFYYPNGENIDSPEDFVGFYSKAYYIQNSKYIEKDIEEILSNGIKKKEDVIHILAWKLGKLKHSASQNNKEYKYFSTWGEVEKDPNKVEFYGKEMHLGDFINDIETNIDVLEELAKDKKPQEVLNILNSYLDDKEVRGIGTVYLVTLLYFISKGKYPIYDRFAQMAITAIKENKRPGDVVEYKELPDRKQRKFNNVFKDYLKEYQEDINGIFKEGEYQKNRDVDRALWVYGHLFYQAKQKRDK